MVCNPGAPARNQLATVMAGLLAHRSSSFAQPSQSLGPVAQQRHDSLFTVAGAALELATRESPHQIPFSSPLSGSPVENHMSFVGFMLAPRAVGRQLHRSDHRPIPPDGVPATRRPNLAVSFPQRQADCYSAGSSQPITILMKTLP